MTDLRNVAVIGMMGRLNMLIDEATVAISPSEVKQWIANGTILDYLRALYGDFPEFTPVHEALGAEDREQGRCWGHWATERL
jgi:hypothetical protein